MRSTESLAGLRIGVPTHARILRGTCARILRGLGSLVALVAALPALAHETGLSYLRVRVDGTALAIEVDLGLGDAAAALGIEFARDTAPTSEAAAALAREQLFAQVAARGDELEARVRAGLGFWQDGAACSLVEAPTDLARAEEIGFVRLRLRARCPAPVGVLGLEWRLPFAKDPQHRTLVSVAAGPIPQSAILSARRQRVELGIGTPR
jgi:hypothetical protein